MLYSGMWVCAFWMVCAFTWSGFQDDFLVSLFGWLVWYSSCRGRFAAVGWVGWCVFDWFLGGGVSASGILFLGFGLA